MNMLEPGMQVPEIFGTDQDGNTISSNNFKGKKLVLFFYPRANTPGCTQEACNLRDNYQLLLEKGYKILGVSDDSQKKQLNFKNKYQFPFPLIADTDRKLVEAFGVWGPKKFMGRVFDGIHRKTFVIDESGLVERVIEKVVTKDHAAQILEES